MGHWYAANGTPMYTITGKNGKERDTTLADARKLNLRPSVTEITKLMDKPGLTNWMIDQAILSALTCPRLDEESETELLSRIKKDAQEQVKKAAERGTQIHGWVEDGFGGKSIEDEGMFFFLSAKKKLDEVCGQVNWTSEQTFSTQRYAGKCDLHSDKYLVDFKSTDKPLEKLNLWDEHLMQLPAYANGLWCYKDGRCIAAFDSVYMKDKKCGILYIHKETAECNLLWATNEQIQRGYEMFTDLVNLFYHKTGL